MSNVKCQMSNEGRDYSNNKLLNWIFVILSLVITVGGGFGCAKTVTNVNFGSTLSVTVTLRGNIDVSSNRYFLVLADDPTFKFPLPPPNNLQYEFLEPDGAKPQDGSSLEAYYTDFFSTWASYVVLDSGGYFALPGPFVQSAPITRPGPFALYTSGSNKISFNFQLNRLYPAGVPSNAYFDFVTVKWPAAGQKQSADHLESTNAYIATMSGSRLSVSDAPDSTIDPSLDILSIEVSVQ
jgi:hypothetical protein